MKRLGLVFGFLAMTAICVAAASPFQGQQDPQTDMEKWLSYGTPGEQQQWLARRVGVWEMEISQFNGTAEPVRTSAVATYEMIMGGRYLVETVHGQNDIGPFEGVSVIGFDNARKAFVSNWIDNMGTGITSSIGTRSPDGNKINWEVSATDPLSGMVMEMRNVEWHISRDKVVTTIFSTAPDGMEVKVMEIVYTRTE